jgi:hypothetical protein
MCGSGFAGTAASATAFLDELLASVEVNDALARSQLPGGR